MQDMEQRTQMIAALAQLVDELASPDLTIDQSRTLCPQLFDLLDRLQRPKSPALGMSAEPPESTAGRPPRRVDEERGSAEPPGSTPYVRLDHSAPEGTEPGPNRSVKLPLRRRLFAGLLGRA